MLVHYLVNTDTAIYWQLTGYDTFGQEQFTAPVLIRCRWDTVQKNIQLADSIETETATNTVFPDRVLVVNSWLMLAEQQMLATLTQEQQSNPRLNRDARQILRQSITGELARRQVSDYLADPVYLDFFNRYGYAPPYLTIEASVGQ